jgi:nucleoid-associated protein YgaU
MNDSVRRTAAGVLTLVVLWVCVYWWWPSEPRISFAQADSAADSDQDQDASDADQQPTPRREVSQPEQVRPLPDPKPPVPAPQDESSRTPVPAPLITPPEFIEHTVERGETFGSISRRYFGSTRHANDIARANPFIDPSRLRPGRVIRVPKDPENIQGKPAVPSSPVTPVTPAPGSVSYDTTRSYTVVAGDTLSRISQKMYGTQANTTLIFESNRNLLASPDDLAIGQVLVIPPATGPAPPPR